MRQLRFVFLVAVVSTMGCAASLPHAAKLPGSDDRAAIEAAVYAWRIAGLPWSSTCNEELSRVHLVVTEPKEFTELCGRRPVHAGGRLYACTTQQYEQTFPYYLLDSDRVPLLVISELQPKEHRRLLIVHETMHWLERCSGKGIDFDHSDQRVWHGARLVAQRGVERMFASRHTAKRTAKR